MNKSINKSEMESGGHHRNGQGKTGHQYCKRRHVIVTTHIVGERLFFYTFYESVDFPSILCCQLLCSLVTSSVKFSILRLVFKISSHTFLSLLPQAPFIWVTSVFWHPLLFMRTTFLYQQSSLFVLYLIPPKQIFSKFIWTP